MAIVSFTNYKRGQSSGCMGAVMRYTMQDKKTQFEGQRLVTGINCQPESVYSEFMMTKRLYHKTDGVMFYHMVQSFPKDEAVDPATAHAAALKLAEYYEGCEVLVCTHTDREHIHSHFLINSVNFDSGRKLHIAKEQLQELRQRNDQVCMEFSLPVFEPREQKQKTKTMTIGEYHTAARGQSKKLQLMNMFSGLVYCADCGKPMVLHRAHTMKPEQNNFTCRTYKKDGAEACTGHYIREVALTEIVLETIRRAAAFARSHPEQFAEYIQQKQSSEVAKEIKLVERELSAMKKRAGELDTVFKRMYEDSALGRVTSEQFRMLSAAYTEEKKQLAESIPEKAERLEKLRSSVANARNFIAKAKRFTDMDALTPELLHTFVAKIIVYEKEVKYSKHSPQKVRIQFRDFDLTEDTADIIEEETAKTTEKADSAIALSA